MADIFISYATSDRPRAETLVSWFADAGWSVWIDRHTDVGEKWAERIQKELDSARLVVVLWGPEARRSEWVQREAVAALESGRLLQILATGLPLLPPFDEIQAVRMQSWSGESGHSERIKLLRAVAERLDTPLPEHLSAEKSDEDLTAYHAGIVEAFELAFYYCARQVERARVQRDRGYGVVTDLDEIGKCFDAMLALLRTEAHLTDDRDGVLHRLMEGFMNELEALAPDRHALK